MKNRKTKRRRGCTCRRRAARSAFRCVHTEMPELWHRQPAGAGIHSPLRPSLSACRTLPFLSAFHLRLQLFPFFFKCFSYSRADLIVRHCHHSGSNFSPFLRLVSLSHFISFFLSLRLSSTTTTEPMLPFDRFPPTISAGLSFDREVKSADGDGNGSCGHLSPENAIENIPH